MGSAASSNSNDNYKKHPQPQSYQAFLADVAEANNM